MALYDREQRIYGKKHFDDAVYLDGAKYEPNIKTLTTTGYYVSTNDKITAIVQDTTALTADITIGLPSCSANKGRILEFHKCSARNDYKMILDPHGSDTINGFSTYELWDQYTWVILKATATSWLRVGGTTSKLLPEENRATDWQLDAAETSGVWTDAWVSNDYTPSGAVRITMKVALTWTGNDSADFAYALLRQNGSATTDPNALHQIVAWQTDAPSGKLVQWYNELECLCDANGVVEYYIYTASGERIAGTLYLETIGYSYE